MQRLALLPVLLLLPACPSDPQILEDTGDLPESTGDLSSSTGDPTTGEPAAPGECVYGPAAATRLALVTNDFTAASLHIASINPPDLSEDVAAVTTDPALSWGNDMLAVLGRYTFNRVTLLDSVDWAARFDFPVSVDGADEPNPQSLTFAADGRAYLTLLASPKIPIFDFTAPPEENPVGALDLTDFADADGSPEAGVALACGDVLFVGIQRLVEFVPVDHSYLVPIDLTTQRPIDLDPATDGPQAIELLGPWPKQIRQDPADATGHTALVLTSGVERVDLVAGTSSWAVTPERLTALEIDGFDVQSFAVAPDGASVYIVATDGMFPASALHQFGLADESATTITTGLTTSEKALEILGTTLWIADADPDAPRLRRFDLTQSPPTEGDWVATPPPPYLLFAIPLFPAHLSSRPASRSPPATRRSSTPRAPTSTAPRPSSAPRRSQPRAAAPSPTPATS